MLRSTRKLSQKFVPLSALLLGFTLFSAPSWADESHAAANPASLAPRPAPEKFWTDLPAITPGGPRAERGMVSLTPRNISTTELQLFNPNEPAKPVQLILDGGRWLVAPSSPDKGGHHWLSTRESNGNKVITASTAWSFPAKGDALFVGCAWRARLRLQRRRIHQHDRFGLAAQALIAAGGRVLVQRRARRLAPTCVVEEFLNLAAAQIVIHGIGASRHRYARSSRRNLQAGRFALRRHSLAELPAAAPEDRRPAVPAIQ